MYDFSKKITSFHDTHVTLSMSLRNDMKARRDANRDRIIAGLKDGGKPAPVEWINQGGYAQRTMTQPPEGDEESRYDIDMGVVFAEADAKTPATMKKWVRDAIAAKATNMKNEPEVKPKCVRIVYADGYQCDFPVFKNAPKISEGYELAANEFWLRSDPKSMNKWVEDSVSSLSPSEAIAQLRPIIRLVKYFAKVYGYKKRVKFPSGLLATAIAVECYRPSEGRIDHAFRETLRAISMRSQLSPVFANGVQISDAKDVARITRLIDCAKDAVSALDELDSSNADENLANKAWKKVFRHSFFEPPEQKPASGSSGFAKSTASAFGISAAEQAARAQSAASDLIKNKAASKPFALPDGEHDPD